MQELPNWLHYEPNILFLFLISNMIRLLLDDIFIDHLDIKSKYVCFVYSVQIPTTCLWVIMWTGVIIQLRL